jgi:hypothetical protein
MKTIAFYASENGITIKGYDAPGSYDEGLVEVTIKDPEGDPDLTIKQSFCPEGSRNRSHQFYTCNEHLAQLIYDCIESGPAVRANLREMNELFAE